MFHDMEQTRTLDGTPIATATLPWGENGAAIEALLTSKTAGVLALITRIDGPSYRPLGAAMALFPDDETWIGSLSGGCVERDLLHHASAALSDRKGRTVRYGIGSPYMDIQLPCGGALEITLVPNPASTMLSRTCKQRHARVPAQLNIDLKAGALADDLVKSCMQVTYEPDIHFTVMGKGQEATVFKALATAAGYPADLWSPDAEPSKRLTKDTFPRDATADPWSAIVLFFHDHDWEPALLKAALKTEAFYIGAQGSTRARAARDNALSAMGVSDADIARIKGPIGLIPSARDSKTLAVSVLADVLNTFRAQR